MKRSARRLASNAHRWRKNRQQDGLMM